MTNGHIRTLGTVQLKLHIGQGRFPANFHVVPDNFQISQSGILGRDFLEEQAADVKYSSLELKIGNCRTKLRDTVSSCSLIEIPPNCDILREFDSTALGSSASHDQVVLSGELEDGVYLGASVFSGKTPVIRIVNTTDDIVNIPFEKVKERFRPFRRYDVKVVEKTSGRVEKLIKILKDRVPEYAAPEVLGLCEEYSEIFLLDGEAVSCCNFFEADLQPKDKEIVYNAQYRLPHANRDIMIQMNKDLLAHDIIEESNSPHNSPVLLVPKAGPKKWRMVLDYRKVNLKLLPVRTPIPRMDEIFDNLGGSTIFSVLDLASGFHQIPLKEEARKLTSFTTPLGQFQFKRLPFGLSVSPGLFSRMMSIAFSKLIPGKAWVYMDDLVCLGRSEKDHLKNLREIFEICRSKNLKLNPLKSNFFRPEVTYLGHLLSKEGVKPNPAKYQTIKSYPTPTSGDEAKRFVAFCNFYRKFIPGFSTLSRPLTALSKKNVKFKWTEECEKAFQTLKSKLLSPRILQYPNFELPFKITCDASNVGCGACLSQVNAKGEDLPISFASRNFTKGEANKPAIEQELVAMHWAIMHFKPYIYNTRFLVHTDHRPLVFLYNLKNPTGKLARIRLDLAEYSFDIEYIKGSTNVVADALSRIKVESIRESGAKAAEATVGILTRAQAKNQALNANGPMERTTKPQPNLGKIFETKNNLPYLSVPILQLDIINDNIEAKEAKLQATVHYANTKGSRKKGQRKECVLKVSQLLFPKRKLSLEGTSQLAGDAQPQQLAKGANGPRAVTKIPTNREPEPKPKPKVTADRVLDALGKLLRRVRGTMEAYGNSTMKVRESTTTPKKVTGKSTTKSRESTSQPEQHATRQGNSTIKFRESTATPIKVTGKSTTSRRESTSQPEQHAGKSTARSRESTAKTAKSSGKSTTKSRESTIKPTKAAEKSTTLSRESTAPSVTNNAQDCTEHAEFTLRMYENSHVISMVGKSKFKEKVNSGDHGLVIVLCKTPKVITDLAERSELIKLYHEDELLGGHCGPAKLLAKLKSNFFWPGMRKQVFNFAKVCVKCQLNKGHAKTKQPFVITDTPQGAFDVVEMDTVGPLLVCSGYKYILTMQCALTRYVIAAPMKDKSASATAKALFNHFIYIHGFPKVIKTDRGTEFKNALMEEITKLCNIKHRLSTAFHHETMGIVERNHRVLNNYFRNYSEKFTTNWPQLIKLYCFSWNTTPNDKIKNYTPHELVYGKSPNLPNFLNFEEIEPIYDLENYAKEIRKNLQVSQNAARLSQEARKLDRHRLSEEGARPIKLSPGDLVKLTNDSRIQKQDPWYSGPYVVVEVGESNCVIMHKANRNVMEVHKNRLATYYENQG